MKFNYKARTETGGIQAGAIEASSREAALNLLQKHGVYVTFLEGIRVQPFYLKRIKFFKRKVPKKEIVLFTRQISVLFKSGVPLPESLLALAAQAENPTFKEIVLRIEEEIEGGVSLSQALARHPHLFSAFYVNMVKAGEVAGKLSETLSYLANHLEREYLLNSKVKGAMMYPLFILVVFCAIFLAMIFFVLPNFSELLSEMKQELPPITKLVMGTGEFIRTKGWILLIILFGIFVFLSRYIKTKEGKENFDKISLKIPLIKEFFKKIYLSRFAENLSTLISGGIPIARALDVTGEIVGNTVYKNIILQAKEGVKRGDSISSILGRYPDEIPPFFVQMTVVGEKTGRLDECLRDAVDFYKKEVDRSLNSLTELLEPIMIVILGLAVAILMISVLMPLYQTMGSF